MHIGHKRFNIIPFLRLISSYHLSKSLYINKMDTVSLQLEFPFIYLCLTDKNSLYMKRIVLFRNGGRISQ